ncbi:hypothetical protein [Streptomyces platensis]|uniref:hypothetical protein n=1 Tax=Streptomyces platensis TaxID=58346 RepID=UPI0036C12919
MAEDAFTEHRPLLFTLVYEILGSAADAEEIAHRARRPITGRAETVLPLDRGGHPLWRP